MAHWSKRTSKWLNAVGYAWSMGEAPWAYEGPRVTSVAFRVWSEAYEATGSEDAATDALEALARDRGVDPRRHRWHGKG